MENRRSDYRVVFTLQDALPVKLESMPLRQALQGQVVDLSVGGMRVRFSGHRMQLSPTELWIAQPTLPGLPGSLAMRSAIVYSRARQSGSEYGVHFLPLADRDLTEARAKLIWRFLLEEQRKRIALARSGAASAAWVLRIYRSDEP